MVDKIPRRKVSYNLWVVANHAVPVDLTVKRLIGALCSVVERTAVIHAIDFAGGVNQAVVILVDIPVGQKGINGEAFGHSVIVLGLRFTHTAHVRRNKRRIGSVVVHFIFWRVEPQEVINLRGVVFCSNVTAISVFRTLDDKLTPLRVLHEFGSSTTAEVLYIGEV